MTPTVKGQDKTKGKENGSVMRVERAGAHIERGSLVGTPAPRCWLIIIRHLHFIKGLPLYEGRQTKRG